MKDTLIPIVISALGSIPESVGKGLESLKWED